MENALNQPERGDLQLAQVQTYLSVEIDPSNNSLRFTHNPSVEKLLATTHSGWNTQKHNTHHIYGERSQGHELLHKGTMFYSKQLSQACSLHSLTIHTLENHIEKCTQSTRAWRSPSNSSLRFTHNLTHNPSVEKLLVTAHSGTHMYLEWRNFQQTDTHTTVYADSPLVTGR